ncbi:MAG: von Willebrand factor type A domain-containing protein [Acidobacteriota bacterium]
MNRYSDKDLEKLLSAGEPAPAPEGLAQRIKDDIPDDLSLAPAPPTEGPVELAPDPRFGPRFGLRRSLVLAATLVLALGAAVFFQRHRAELAPALFEGPPVGARGTAAAPAAAEGPAPAPQRGDGALNDGAQRDRAEALAEALQPSTPLTEASAPDALRRQGERADRGDVYRSSDDAGSVGAVRQEKLEAAKKELRSRLRQIAPVGDPSEGRGLAPQEPAAAGAGTVEEPRVRGGRDERKSLGKPVVARSRASFDEEIQVTAPLPVFESRGTHSSLSVDSADAEAEQSGADGDMAVVFRPAPEPVAAPPSPPSTGGTGVPNGAAHDAMFFDSAGVHPFVDAEDDALSTFGLDVDTASYTLARRYLRDGDLPPADAVRVEEFVNYFDYGDPPPEPGEGDFALTAEGAPSLYGPGERYHLVRLAIRGRDVASEDRQPSTLTFVVDVSGSMDRENRLGLVKRSLHLLLEQLRPDDRVALVVYGSAGRVVLEPTGNKGRAAAAIDALVPEGSTNAEEGLRLAYALAARHREPGRIHRVILCSDGVANVGETSAEAILQRVRGHAREGIELTTVGFGMGNYNDVLMERLANQGNGRYAYVDGIEEARRIFVTSLTGTLQTLAAEARAQVEWDSEVVSRWRLLGYENRDIADERFRDDTVDAGEIGVGHTVTVLYEVKTHRPLRRRDRLGTLHLRYGSIAAGEMVEQSLDIRGRDLASTWDGASRSLRLAALVAQTAEVLRESFWAKGTDLDDVFRRTQRVATEYPGDTDVAELASLVGTAAKLRGRR